MYYDAAQKAWIDSDTQAVIFREDGGDITPADAGQQSSDGRDIIPTTIAPVVVSEDGKIELGGVPLGIDSRGSKYQVLEMIPLDESQKHSNASSGGDISPPAAALLSPGTIARPSFNSMGISKAPSASTIPAAGQVSNLERELIAMHSSGNAEYLRLEEGTHEAIEIGDDGEAKTHHMWDDWTVARALQAMEFEISADQLQRDARDEDFNNKELRSSSCKRQFLTVSFAICIAQIALMIAVIQEYGYAPYRENPVVGPPAEGLVAYGAKVAYLIVKKNEWWRLLATVMLHGGIWHIIPNVLIQLRIGGYLNLIFGTVRWLFIYLMAGIFGGMMSCIFLPDAVGVGSSGALLGILSAWLVWIIFRWKKIPKECHTQRNCQLAIVLAAVVITLATSFSPNVDWAAHFGGALQGLLWGIVLLSNELDNNYTEWSLRVISAVIALGLIGYSAYYMVVELDPEDPFANTVAD